MPRARASEEVTGVGGVEEQAAQGVEEQHAHRDQALGEAELGHDGDDFRADAEQVGDGSPSIVSKPWVSARRRGALLYYVRQLGCEEKESEERQGDREGQRRVCDHP